MSLQKYLIFFLTIYITILYKNIHNFDNFNVLQFFRIQPLCEKKEKKNKKVVK